MTVMNCCSLHAENKEVSSLQAAAKTSESDSETQVLKDRPQQKRQISAAVYC